MPKAAILPTWRSIIVPREMVDRLDALGREIVAELPPPPVRSPDARVARLPRNQIIAIALDALEKSRARKRTK